jgi:hypothetical protein
VSCAMCHVPGVSCCCVLRTSDFFKLRLYACRLLVHIYNRRIQNNHSKSSALWITFFFSHFIYEVRPLHSFLLPQETFE